jgi:hypothetical protein
MSRHPVETRKYLFGALSRDLDVQRVSTQIDLVAPAKLARRSKGYASKHFRVVPQLEHAFADQTRKVHNARNAIGVLEP